MVKYRTTKPRIMLLFVLCMAAANISADAFKGNWTETFELKHNLKITHQPDIITLKDSSGNGIAAQHIKWADDHLDVNTNMTRQEFVTAISASDLS